MSVFSLIVDVLGPVVVIVGLGAAAGGKLGIRIDSLSPLAYWILGPAFVYRIFASSDLSGGIAARLAIAGITGMIAAAAVTWLASSAIGSTSSARAADVMTASYGNVGNTGLAVSIFALGDEALAAAGILMLAINATGMMAGIALASAQQVGLGTALRRALLAPMTLAAVVAFGANTANVELPLAADRSLNLLADALIPIMLLALGIQLASTGWRPPTLGFGVSAVGKLLIAPVAAVTVGSALGLSGVNLGVVAIQSAMPPAVFCLIVAQEHQLEPERVTANVVTMTLMSLITLPIVLILTR